MLTVTDICMECFDLQPIDMISAVKEFHALSKEDLSKLIKDGKNGNIQWTKANVTSFEVGRFYIQSFIH